MLRNFFKSLKSGTEHLNYGRAILQQWGADYSGSVKEDRRVKILDIGCGHGTDLLNIRGEVERRWGISDLLELNGIENYPPYVEECREKGIQVRSLDVERDLYPWSDGTFDLIIANQVLEHTKEIFWILSECVRLLRPGGRLIIGVPNLASLHNRLLLLMGEQPTAIQAYSAHVRGFTRKDFCTFAEKGGFLKYLEFRGSNFYPFAESISRPLSRIFPSMAWGLFMLFEKQERSGSFLECLQGEGNLLETPYYGSPQNPASKRKRSSEREEAPGSSKKSRSQGRSSKKAQSKKGRSR